jgi:hypothetical protein
LERRDGVVLNDAGVGLNGAGIGSLAFCENYGMKAATVSHLSARIGDVADMPICCAAASSARPIPSHDGSAGTSLGCPVPRQRRGPR